MSNHQGPRPDDVIDISGGRSHIGTAHPLIRADGEGPPRSVVLKPYGLAATTVTMEQFAAFVEASGHVTDAERFGWSFVFRGLLDRSRGPQPPGLPWWNRVEGASWRTPLGPGSCWQELADHPVVHVSWHDARAYANWVGGRLPSEAEWEHAARGGPQHQRYPWGDEEPSDHSAGYCNIWQGNFPHYNTEADGYYGTAPARSFPPNTIGMYNMAGNVWEWCEDSLRIHSLTRTARRRNQEARRQREKVLKGGSFLCHSNYCHRYRIAARTGRQSDNSTSNCGFRIAFDIAER